ncbi:uncharacterized protein LOC122716962 isoform X2 [Apis laboriosa]|uniref:uncharacterized protein LOC122716962 isoform X2 n=1 Tax=Apis laboriosa TaxID=183418 RepID=UPI001CC42E74|nr:uncharacterized protein LOC122716962 isoform X2 [Apis laboriosa]
MFLLSRIVSRFYPLLLFVGANLVISMPAPSSRRSSELASDDVAGGGEGFSNVPKILEIQLPLRIATKEDLVAWARYVMGLMASRINITLTTVKESPSRIAGRAEKIAKQYPVKNTAYRYLEGGGSDGGRHFVKSFENTRYAENVRNVGRVTSVDRDKIPAAVRIATENVDGHVENSVQNGDVQSSRERVYSTSRLPTIAMLDGAIGKGSFNDRRLFQPIFAISDSTIPSPLHVNIPKPGIGKDPDSNDSFDTNFLKTGDRQLFVPQFPNFGPAIELKPNGIFPDTSAVSPPTRAYLPVATTTVTADNVEFPNDPFVARYLYDGVGRNVSSNVLPETVTPLFTTDQITSSPPTRNLPLVPSRNRNTSSATPLFKAVPFEAVITFTRDEPYHIRGRNEGGEYSAVSTPKDPPPRDRFPPYFDASNHTLTNESGRIDVVLDDEGRAIEAGLLGEKEGGREEERKKEERKKDEGSKGEKSKKRKPEKKATSPLGQLIKSFVALRRNSTLVANLVPPLPLRQRTPTTQRIPSRQRAPPPTRTQLYSTEKPPSALRQGRRNQTSLAQQQTEGGKEGSEEVSAREEGKEEAEESKESEDVEDVEGGIENEASSEENSDEEEEGGGGPINAIISLLQLAAPILEDLSDPESETDIAEVLEVGIPLLQDLSQGDDETPGVDFPGLLVPILLQISGEDGMRDSGAILTPLLQLSAPLIGPLVGPLVVPLSRQSSQPPGQGSSISNLIKGLLAPLLEPIGPYGKMTQLSNLIAGIVSSLSKNSGAGGASDLTSLVKAVVAGSVAGTSAGSSGNKDSYGADAAYA